MTAYNIRINEEQRLLLETLLVQVQQAEFDIHWNGRWVDVNSVTNLSIGDTESEVAILSTLLHDLPYEEEKAPGVLHGFCL